MKSRIMIIESNETTSAMLKRMFSYDYDIFQKSPTDLKESDFSTFMPDLVLFGIDKDIQPAIDLLKSSPNVEGLDGIPVIVMMAPDLPEKEKLLFESGATDVIMKPLYKEKLIARVDSVLDLLSLRSDMSAQVRVRSREMTKFSMQSMLVIADAIDKKSMYEHKHSREVAESAVKTARRLGWSDERIESLYSMALVYDIGKIGIPDKILNKNGTLNDVEFEQMKRHTEIGSKMLKELRMIIKASEIAETHHERYDGKGYPFGLKGNEIPEESRIIAIADAFDAMISKRPFRDEMSKEAALEELRKGRGTQFDPVITDIFLSLIEGGEISAERINGKDDDRGKIVGADLLESSSKADDDELTGCKCIEYASMVYTKRLLDKHNRSGMILMDIDGFESILKRYGHFTGDEVVKKLSSIIMKYADKESIVSRVAGDRFMILTGSGKNRQEICNELESIAQEFYNDGSVQNITNLRFSAGIATATYAGTSFETLFANADKALYYVKHNDKKLYHFFDENNRPGDPSRRMASADIEKLKRESYDRNVMLILFSVLDPDGRILDVTLQRNSMLKLFDSVAKAVRDEGESKKYSSSQVLAVMPEATESAAYLLAEKVRKNFMGFAQGRNIILSYDICEVKKK